MKRVWTQLRFRRTIPLICSLMLVWLVAALSPPAQAEQAVELWRGGGFYGPHSVSVNPSDGSCWVAEIGSGQVVHLAQDGTQLWRGGGFYQPASVSVNPTDGSCWVADFGNSQVVHLAEDGTQLWRGGGFTWPWSVSVNPSDGSCWVADAHFDASQGWVVHLAQDGTQLWRGGGFYWPASVSVNPSDGSCWVAEFGPGQVVHLAEDGTQLWRGGGFGMPESVSVNPSDGSCWVEVGGIVHLAQDGTLLWAGGGFNGPLSVSVNAANGSCWVADTFNHQIVHLAQDGTQLWRGGGFDDPYSVSVNSTDNSCWVADFGNNQVVHLAVHLTVTASADPPIVPHGGTTNLTASYSDYFGHSIAAWHWSDGGAGGSFSPSAGVQNPSYTAVNTTDADRTVTLAVSATCNGPSPDTGVSSTTLTVQPVAHTLTVTPSSPNPDTVTSGGTTALSAGFSDSRSAHTIASWSWDDGGAGGTFTPSANVQNPSYTAPVNGTAGDLTVTLTVSATCNGPSPLVDTDSTTLTVLQEQVGDLKRVAGFNHPYSVSANPTDGSCWVADTGDNQVVHLEQNGAERWRGGALNSPRSVSVNAADGSCWVADTGNNQVVHLDADGTELWRGGGFSAPGSVSANPADGSCWVADTGNSQVVHLAQSGAELWRSAGAPTFSGPYCVSVNPADGSCWVADTGNNQVVHLAVSGAELWRGGGFSGPASVSVNSADGTCWVADTGNNQIVHLAASGTELWRGGGYSSPYSVSVNRTDGSCWVADTNNNQVVHLAQNGTELWRGGAFSYPASVSVSPTDGTCWVADTNEPFQPMGTGVSPADGRRRMADDVVVHLGVHTLGASASANPATVLGGGTTSLTATSLDSLGDTIATWSWSDGGAGGSFIPSASVQNPTYTAPLNYNTSDLTVALRVTVTCGGPIPVSAGGSATLTVQPNAVVFGDVSTSHPFRRFIEAIYREGITEGCSGSPLNYCPANTVTRGQMAVFLCKAAGQTQLNSPSPRFTDVPQSHPFYGWIERLADAASWGGTPPTTGCTATEYCPGTQVTRGQMAAFLCRAVAQTTLTPPTPSFNDVPNTHPFYGWIERLADPGSWIVPPTTGCAMGPPRLYCPTQNVTRGQMAAFLCRAFNIPY